MQQTPGEAPAGRQRDDKVVLGRISGLFGVRGWVKVYSYAEPPENIFQYAPWYVQDQQTDQGEWRPLQVLEGKRHGKGLIARLQGVDDRDAASLWIGADIAIARAQLPALPAGEYYWSDLQGLEVITAAGQVLGVIDHLLSTGANDVLVVRGERERLLPYLPGRVVLEVDLAGGRMVVDWDADF